MRRVQVQAYRSTPLQWLSYYRGKTGLGSATIDLLYGRYTHDLTATTPSRTEGALTRVYDYLKGDGQPGQCTITRPLVPQVFPKTDGTRFTLVISWALRFTPDGQPVTKAWVVQLEGIATGVHHLVDKALEEVPAFKESNEVFKAITTYLVAEAVEHLGLGALLGQLPEARDGGQTRGADHPVREGGQPCAEGRPVRLRLPRVPGGGHGRVQADGDGNPRQAERDRVHPDHSQIPLVRAHPARLRRHHRRIPRLSPHRLTQRQGAPSRARRPKQDPRGGRQSVSADPQPQQLAGAVSGFQGRRPRRSRPAHGDGEGRPERLSDQRLARLCSVCPKNCPAATPTITTRPAPTPAVTPSGTAKPGTLVRPRTARERASAPVPC